MESCPVRAVPEFISYYSVGGAVQVEKALRFLAIFVITPSRWSRDQSNNNDRGAPSFMTNITSHGPPRPPITPCAPNHRRSDYPTDSIDSGLSPFQLTDVCQVRR